MERKNIMCLSNVLLAAKQLCSIKEGEPCELFSVSLNLSDGKELRKHVSFNICKASEEEEAKDYLKRGEGMSVRDFINYNPYHHVCTFADSIDLENGISFDPEDDWPIKAGFHIEDTPLVAFFYGYNNYRNDALDRGETLDYNDIFNKMHEFAKKADKNGERKRTIFQKIKSRLSS